MNLTDIKTWVVTHDHKARPKNENRCDVGIFVACVNLPDGPNCDGCNAYIDFEQQCKGLTFACSESLVNGEYAAEDLELVWQYLTKKDVWFNYKEQDAFGGSYDRYRVYMIEEMNCVDTRKFLQPKSPMKKEVKEQEVPKDITNRKTDLGLSNNIEPCPFCGGTEGEQVFLGRTEPDHYQITCICCSVKMKHDRKDKVIGIWNNRKPLSDFN